MRRASHESRSARIGQGRARLLALALLLAGASCGGDTAGPRPAGPPAALAIVSGDAQSATVATELPAALVVRVSDANGIPVKGQLVNFRVVAGGGAVFAGSALTNDAGECRERWTLGTAAADSQRVEARAVDATTGAAVVFAVFRANALAGAATRLRKAGGDSAQAVAGTTVPSPPAVMALDRYDNPVAGATVTFAITGGAGSVAGATQVTGANGIATLTGWTLGSVAGANTLSATLSGAATAPVSFVATGKAGSPAQIAFVAGGNTAVIHSLFTPAPAVRVRDAKNNPVSNARVVFTPTGSVGSSIENQVSFTDANGIATAAGWRAGTRVGIAKLSAWMEEIPDSLVNFTATITEGPPVALSLNEPASAVSGAPFATQPVLTVLDSGTNVATAANQPVTMTVSGGASIVGDATVPLVNGVARYTNVGLAGRAGTYTVTFTTSGLHFVSTSIVLAAGPPAQVAVLQPGGTLFAGQSRQFNAIVYDAWFNVIAQPVVAWSSSNPQIASVDAAGVVTALTSGSTMVSATAGGRTGTLPVQVAPAFELVALTAGVNMTCELRATGAVYCWGSNHAGELGDGGTLDQPRPVAVLGGGAFTAVSAGSAHVCALTGSGAAYCWGHGNYGVLIAGSTNSPSTPVAVPGGITFGSISAGGEFNCGLDAAGAAYCWGDNSVGELGDGTTTNRSVPTRVQGGLAFASIAASYAHVCALTSAGKAYCWGHDVGALGRSGDPLVPGPVSQGELVFTSIATGGDASCGLTASGSAYCWGRNASGNLGDGTIDTRAVPTLVQGGLSFAALTMGFNNSCGLTAAGAAWCWGHGSSGANGDGTTERRLSPVAVKGGLVFATITTGVTHTCGLTTAHAAYCWGSNLQGALGTETTTDKLEPAPVAHR